MTVSLVCVALLALLCIGLGLNVTVMRGRTGVMFGADADPTSSMYKAMRAHGNTIEYAPLLALLIYILGQSPQDPWVIWAMVLVTFFRYLFAAGILFSETMAKPQPLRFIGFLGTVLCAAALIIALLMQAAGT